MRKAPMKLKKASPTKMKKGPMKDFWSAMRKIEKVRAQHAEGSWEKPDARYTVEGQTYGTTNLNKLKSAFRR